MSIKDPWSVKQLVEATQQLHATRLYERFSDNDCFMIRTPKQAEPAVVTLMGYAGQAFGLTVFLGPGALDSFMSLYTGDEGHSHGAVRRMRIFGYEMREFRDMMHDSRKWLKGAGIKPRNHELYPDPMSLEPGAQARSNLKDRETQLLLQIVRGILDAATKKTFEPCGIDSHGRILCLNLTEDTRNPTAEITWEETGYTSTISDPTLIPSPDDIDAWKMVDAWLKELMFGGFNHDHRYRGSRALTRYFGPESIPGDLFEKYRRLMIVDSYAFWFTFSYRSARNRPTVAEQWLDDPEMPQALKQLIESAAAQAPSIHRVEDVDSDNGKITFSDVFTGDVTIVTDFAMSTCVQPGLLMPATLVPAGDFHLLYPNGPITNGMRFGRVLEFFEHHHITPSPKYFKAQAHVLGWLWYLHDQLDESKPDIRNCDGHVLVPHTAIFACPDRAALERFLKSRPAFQIDNDEDHWVWIRPDTDLPTDAPKGTHQYDTTTEIPEGQVVLLARLELADDQFTLTTNSRERLEAAREILENVEGVRILSFDATLLDPGRQTDEKNPPIDAEVSEPDEAGIEMARAYIANYYRDWLDRPVAAFHGKTPRQAADDPKLRPQLVAMIRSMPDPMTSANGAAYVAAPRELLLAELGLD